jgi:hypothetical protein
MGRSINEPALRILSYRYAVVAGAVGAALIQAALGTPASDFG